MVSRSWLTGRGCRTNTGHMTQSKPSHWFKSNIKHDHDRIANNARLEPVHSELTPATGEYVLIVGGSSIGLNVTTQ